MIILTFAHRKSQTKAKAIQEITNKDYSKELSILARKLNLDDETMSFDSEIYFEYLEKNKCRFV